MRPLRIFTPVWGHKNVILLEKALGQSFQWPKNQAAIAHAKWTIFTHPSDLDQVMAVAEKVFPGEIEIQKYSGSKEELTQKRGILMCQAMCLVIEKCLAENAQFLMATPDFIWSDGSLPVLIQLGDQKNVCISLPHPRVLPTILDFIHTMPRNNYDLVTLAMKHPHGSWTTSEFGRNPHGSFMGGIIWRKSGPGLITLQHRMPSPYLVNFVKSDLDFFRQDTATHQAAFGAWDHDWACKLAREQRSRMILSSDLAFMAEVTTAMDNLPPLRPANAREPDEFWLQERTQPLLTHQLNRQYIATFRGEP